jgi:2-hydroxy-3-oxopropionate reductase
MSQIGFVGLGAMGSPMAVNLATKAKGVVVFDIRPEACEAAVKAGATRADKLEALAVCDPILIMVNTGDQVNDVLKALSKCIGPKKGLTVAVMSTVARKQIREIAERYKAIGIEVVDAPVSGGPLLAQLGALSIMMGGTEKQVEKLRPVLEAVSRVIFHVGEVGQGQAMKLVNNVLTICNMVLTPAALRVGLEAGLDLKRMVEVINASAGMNRMTEAWEGALMTFGIMYGTPDARATQLKINEKDIRAYLDLVNEVGTKSAAGEAVLAMVLSDDQVDQAWLDRFQAAMAG